VSRRRTLRWLLAALALVSAALGTAAFAQAGDAGAGQPAGALAKPRTAPAGGPLPRAASPAAAAGQRLFASACSSCHGLDARGIAGRGPSLYGAGAAAADFYLRTGRMPLSEPDDQPVRAPVMFSDAEIRQLVAFVGGLGSGPAIPRVDPAAGDLARGRRVFLSSCAGCHQILARGGIAPGAIAPALAQATPTEIAEAVRTGPYLMPSFSTTQIPQDDLDSLTRYVLWTRHPDNAGGWAIGDIGPIPEGMVAWLIAIVALLGVARLVGERTT
jgi:quinol---cytochrome-c reductase cytochrome c subunit